MKICFMFLFSQLFSFQLLCCISSMSTKKLNSTHDRIPSLFNVFETIFAVLRSENRCVVKMSILYRVDVVT